MNEQKTDYFDMDGVPVSLDKLCRIEPAWAASRIRHVKQTMEAAHKLVDDLIMRSNVPIRGRKKQAVGYVKGLRRAAAELRVILGDNDNE